MWREMNPDKSGFISRKVFKFGSTPSSPHPQPFSQGEKGVKRSTFDTADAGPVHRRKGPQTRNRNILTLRPQVSPKAKLPPSHQGHQCDDQHYTVSQKRRYGRAFDPHPRYENE